MHLPPVTGILQDVRFSSTLSLPVALSEIPWFILTGKAISKALGTRLHGPKEGV